MNSNLLGTIYDIACGNGTPEVRGSRFSLSHIGDREERMNHAAAQWKATAFSLVLVSSSGAITYTVEKGYRDPNVVCRWVTPNSSGKRIYPCACGGIEWQKVDELIGRKIQSGYSLQSVSSLTYEAVYSSVRARNPEKKKTGGIADEISYIGFHHDPTRWFQYHENAVCTLMDSQYSCLATAPYEEVRVQGFL